MLYQISNASVSFGDEDILDSINFEIRDREKIAIVGRNGCGKTTLLKLISGEIEFTKRDSDEDVFIAKSGNPEIGYLKQIAFEDPELSMESEIRKVFRSIEDMKKKLDGMAIALETDHSERAIKEYTDFEDYFTSIGGYYYEKEYETLIHKFGFCDADKNKPLKEFSGGQQTKIAFIKLLLSKPDILLLDEPTNHLDVETIEWLEGYIKNYPKAVVIVSHDRMFLDNIVDVVYEIEYHTTKRYKGNYSDFVRMKRENHEKLLKDYSAQQKEIARLQAIVDRFKNKPTKASMARSKLKAIEHMVKIDRPDEYDNKTFHTNFQPESVTGNDVLFVKDLSIGYDHELSRINIDIKKGDKLGILGGNGLGKSTFLKTIVGNIPPLQGEYRFGTGVEIGYFDQQMAMYSSDKTVLEDFWDEFPSLTQTEIRNMLGAFLFSGDDVFKKVNMLSGGEKVRLALCKIFKRRPNVLILDEPTNHMDIVGKETLESMLKDYKGTLIFVSHDRYFIKQVSQRIMAFEHGNTSVFNFGYEEYLEKKQSAETANNIVTTVEKSEPRVNNNPGKERSKLERKQKKLEEKLESAENRISELKGQLLNPDIQSDYMKLSEIQTLIDEIEEETLADMAEWDELDAQIRDLS
ncbi:MAG: ABC-F type ribosomal protection protein [Butyrivibrio sp.]|nr:ABC-F type ribosomal protection protein [Butyrivibrio sp.]